MSGSNRPQRDLSMSSDLFGSDGEEFNPGNCHPFNLKSKMTDGDNCLICVIHFLVKS